MHDSAEIVGGAAPELIDEARKRLKAGAVRGAAMR